MPSPRKPASSKAAQAAKAARNRKLRAARESEDDNLFVCRKVARPQRRTAAERSLRRWLEVYLPGWFAGPWSDDQLIQLAALEDAVNVGGSRAIAAPRGDGKTTRLSGAILYAVLTGRHEYALLSPATMKLSPKIMSGLIKALSSPGPLREDYPELDPLELIAHKAQRANHVCIVDHGDERLLWEPGGERPYWGRTRIVMPNWPVDYGFGDDYPFRCGSSGAVIETTALMEASRGLFYAKRGRRIRPTISLVDDPQTPKSAKSVVLTNEREDAICRGLAYMGGPESTMSIMAAITVICPDDLSSRLLDHERHPEFAGISHAFFLAFPIGCDPNKPGDRNTPEGKETATAWETYAAQFRNDLANGDSVSAASTALYVAHRFVMDRGAVPSWTYRHPGCLSATEFGMRELIKDPGAFMAEFQNSPIARLSSGEDSVIPTATALSKRLNGYSRCEVPEAAHRLTYFVDCHDSLLYYAVCGWGDSLTGWLIDYGSWPEQHGPYYETKHCRLPIAKHPSITATTVEGRLAQALGCLFGELSARHYRSPDGEQQYNLDLGLVDAGWQSKTVEEFCRQSHRKYGLKAYPAQGVFYAPNKCPISRYTTQPPAGVRRGDEWILVKRRGVVACSFDANRRKEALFRRLSTPPGDPGSLTVHAAPLDYHKLLFDHLHAEYAEQHDGSFGQMNVFKLKPGAPDNHLFDCLVGALTAESILGGRVQTSALLPDAPRPMANRAAAKPRKPKQRSRSLSW